jgi:hypothetical protein
MLIYNKDNTFRRSARKLAAVATLPLPELLNLLPNPLPASQPKSAVHLRTVLSPTVMATVTRTTMKKT